MNDSRVDFVGAIGLLRCGGTGGTEYAVRWDERRGCHVLPMGPRLENESFRETAEREIAWTFDLERGRDFIVSSVPRLHFGTRLVDGSGHATDYGVEFYLADVYGGRGRERLASNPSITRVDRETLLGGRLGDEPILAEQVQLLLAADVLSAD